MYLSSNCAIANVVNRYLDLHFKGNEISNVNISETMRAGENCSIMIFLEVDIRHRLRILLKNVKRKAKRIMYLVSRPDCLVSKLFVILCPVLLPMSCVVSVIACPVLRVLASQTFYIGLPTIIDSPYRIKIFNENTGCQARLIDTKESLMNIVDAHTAFLSEIVVFIIECTSVLTSNQ